MQGIVSKKEEKTGKTGKTYWQLTIDGKTYFTYMKVIADELTQGLGYEFEVDEQGKYSHILAPKRKPELDPKPGAVALTKVETRDTNNQEIRRSCLHAAVQYASQHPELKSLQVIQIASYFESWVNGDFKVEVPKESK